MAVERPAVNGPHMAQRSQDQRSALSLVVLAAASVAVIAVAVTLTTHQTQQQQLVARFTSLGPQAAAFFTSIESFSPFVTPIKSSSSDGSCSCQVSHKG